MKEDQLQIYSNDLFGEVRGLVKDGEPWFLAGNVCRCLGIKNSREALRKIKEKRNNAGIKGVISSDILIETSGGKQKSAIIPERILYELIFQSRKKKAYLFQTWIFDEVLPQLRRYGVYRTEGKLIHRSMTDAIKNEIIPNIESDTGKRFAYSNFQKMINKSLGLPQKIEKDSLSPDILEKIAHRENLVSAMIEEGLDYHRIKDAIADMNK